MHLCAFLPLSLALALSLASPTLPPDILGNTEEWKDIAEINKGLNLREGDIMIPRQKSAILGNQYLWDIPVPYVLSGNLGLNYKGVILRAFEQFRLKSCVDFKPRETEEVYISVEAGDGCWSYVGRQMSPGGQNLSLGNGCRLKGIVEHEFLHALGFWHEQSRYDRDEYVTINFQNIQKGYENYFEKKSENQSTTHGTPYDYYSVMHSGEYDYSNGNGPTIITNRSEFQDVIGQRVEMSEYDVIELNQLYKCNSSVSFLDHCSFDDESLCQMSVCSAANDDYDWQQVKSVSGIDVTDHTYLGNEQNETSYFMHFSTKGRNEGDTARIESRILTPKRDCKVQCLQFYYYHSGNESDQLDIWIREYQNQTDTRGTLRLMERIKEQPGNYWKLHHVSLNANKSFQVVFEAHKGAGNSTGGFSLDDINISETECPHIWQIRNIEKVINEEFDIFSPLYYSSEGYRFEIFFQMFSSLYSIEVRQISGIYDDQLQWPCERRQITVQLLDQNAHMQKRMSYEQSIITDNSDFSWTNPRQTGNEINVNGETVYAGTSYTVFVLSNDMIRKFMKGGDLIMLITMQDISGLLQSSSLPCPKVTVKNFTDTSETSVQQRPCATRALPTPPEMTSTTSTSKPTTGALPTQPQLISTPEPTECECLDVFCNSSGKTASSLILLVVCFLSLMN